MLINLSLNQPKETVSTLVEKLSGDRLGMRDQQVICEFIQIDSNLLEDREKVAEILVNQAIEANYSIRLAVDKGLISVDEGRKLMDIGTIERYEVTADIRKRVGLSVNKNSQKTN